MLLYSIRALSLSFQNFLNQNWTSLQQKNSYFLSKLVPSLEPIFTIAHKKNTSGCGESSTQQLILYYPINFIHSGYLYWFLLILESKTTVRAKSLEKRLSFSFTLRQAPLKMFLAHSQQFYLSLCLRFILDQKMIQDVDC